LEDYKNSVKNMKKIIKQYLENKTRPYWYRRNVKLPEESFKQSFKKKSKIVNYNFDDDIEMISNHRFLKCYYRKHLKKFC
jgi:hypothetical protein